jgi:hypothetical protein
MNHLGKQNYSADLKLVWPSCGLMPALCTDSLANAQGDSGGIIWPNTGCWERGWAGGSFQRGQEAWAS